MDIELYSVIKGTERDLNTQAHGPPSDALKFQNDNEEAQNVNDIKL